jgi:hypothetical protein
MNPSPDPISKYMNILKLTGTSTCHVLIIHVGIVIEQTLSHSKILYDFFTEFVNKKSSKNYVSDGPGIPSRNLYLIRNSP